MQNIEIEFMLWLQNYRNPVLNRFNMFVTLFGNDVLYYPIAGFLLTNGHLSIPLKVSHSVQYREPVRPVQRAT